MKIERQRKIKIKQIDAVKTYIIHSIKIQKLTQQTFIKTKQMLKDFWNIYKEDSKNQNSLFIKKKKMQKSFLQLNNSSKCIEGVSSHFSIFVLPLPLDITEKDLKFLFSPCGTITRVHISYKSLKGYSFAYVHFSELESRQKAKKYYNGKMFGLKFLTVIDDKFQNMQGKRDFYNYDNETDYQETERYESAPKKKVHMNENRDKFSRRFSNNKERSNFSRLDTPQVISRDYRLRSKDRERFSETFSQKSFKKDQENYENTLTKKSPKPQEIEY